MVSKGGNTVGVTSILDSLCFPVAFALVFYRTMRYAVINVWCRIPISKSNIVGKFADRIEYNSWFGFAHH